MLPAPAVKTQVGWLSWPCGEGLGQPAGLQLPPRYSVLSIQHVPSALDPSPCRRSPEAEMCPISLDPDAWVILAPSLAGRGGAGRAVGGESRLSAPIPDEFVSRPRLSPTHFRSRSQDGQQSRCFQYNHILMKYNGLVPNWQPN